ncbi:MAG: InlB B-repeat-containing protein [Peptoniphilus harei]|nr:InlB B-repeat-containing protein [Peptoniphilus harei]
MKKRLTAFLLALIMVAQVIAPGTAWAINESRNYQKEDNKLEEVAKTNAEEYPKLTNKVILDIQKEDTENARKQIQVKKGATTFNTPYLPGQDIPDKDKPRIVGKVSADFKTKGLDGGAFDWEGVFGKDSNGNPGKAKLVFQQWLNNKQTDVSYELEVSKDGTYSWKDWNGEPARIPLYSKGLEPYTYSVYLDQDVSEKVKLLTYRIVGTPSGGGFEKDPETGLNVANIVIDLSIQQVASTKFVSEWHTGLAENNKPPVEGEFNNKIDEYPGYFPFSLENNGQIIIRNDFVNNSDYVDPGYTEYSGSALVKNPEVKVTQGIKFADENDEEGSPTYNLDEANKIITTLDKQHKFKYDLQYDVINGGKFTMTEVIPITFDANGGKFASITEPNAEQKIVKEVEYDGTLTDKAEKPTKDRETFKGWATTQDGTPLTEEEFKEAIKNIKEAKTFYAIWDNNEIQAEELTVHESFKDDDKWVNDFIPSLDTLKGQVKIKDGKGDPQLLADNDTLQILDDSGNPIADDDLKDKLYDKLKEDDSTEVSRKVELKAKVTHANGTSQTVDIPIKVIKNIYEAKTLTEKPFYVPEGYIKVTLDPTTKATDPQKTYYYVNPDAKVVIPGSNPTGVKEQFTRWTIPGKDDQGEPIDITYDLLDRHQFTDETTITAQYEQGKVTVKYVDENNQEINENYHIDGVEYPTEKYGKLGASVLSTDKQLRKDAPEFKGYVYISVAYNIKGAKYRADGKDTVRYRYYKKITTEDKSQSKVHFPVVFDANTGEFTGKKEKVTAYVYCNRQGVTPEKVTFEEVRAEVEKTYNTPTKEGFVFKEWQDKSEDGAKVDDSKVIEKQGNNTPETFYAHYEQASALVKYLDLDGKPIADEFKIDTEKYPTEKEGKAGQDIAKDVFTAETAPKFTGYKFNRIELNPANGKYSLDNKATIKIYYEEVPNVIPANPDGSNPDSVPADYVRVEFVPTEKGTIDGDKVFFVNPKKEVTIPVNNPKAKATYKFKEWKMGADAEGEKYTPSTPKKFTQDTTITATYEETENIIPYNPSVPDPMVRPEGYVKVTFVADDGLKLTEQKAYYVKKNAGIKLGNAELVKPAYEAQTGYKFDKWDKEDDLEIVTTDITVTAKATTLDDVVPKDKPQGGENDKPAGYISVTFKTTDKAGNVEKVVYINPNKAVELTSYAPDVTPITGYEFADWDRPIKEKIQYNDKDVITAKFNEQGAVIPKTNPDGTENKKPAGYKTVTFEIEGQGGKIADKEVTVYYVNPAKDVTVPQPKTAAEIGYEFDKWDTDTTKAKKYTADTTVKGKFKKLDDIIPSTDENGKENAKPEGYVTVTFDKGDYGKEITGQTVYYVNPKADPAVKLGNEKITKPTVTAKVGYKVDGWDKEDTQTITGDLTVTAKYKELDDVIPEKDDDGNNNTIPEGYIKVTFSTETNGKIKGTTDTTKVVYVNPNKAVALKPYAPEVKPNTGYDFADWDTQITKKIQYSDGDTIKALYNEKDDVIPQVNDDGSTNDKPDGYYTVTFDKGEHGKELTGKTVYYVKPNKKVTVPAPTVTPNTGWKQKDGIEAWDKALTQTFTGNTKITAQYTKLDNVIPGDQTKPEGYVTVTFKPDENGTLSGTTSYHVNPNVEVNLKDKADAIKKTANTGYTADGGTWDKALKATFTQDAEFTFNFAKLGDVIPKDKPEGGENTKPEGYVIVEFIAGVNGKLVGGNKTYYVNPTKDIKVGDLTIPKPQANNGYEFLRWAESIDENEVINGNKKFEAIFVPITKNPDNPNPDNPDRPDDPYYPERPDYPYYPERPYYPLRPEVRYETVIQEKVIKVPVPDHAYVKEVRYMQGFKGDFRPKDGLTRAEAAQILANALVEDGYKYNANFKLPYKDIGEAWYTRAVKIVTEANVFAGYDDGNFKPQDKITRNEWIATLKRFQELGDVSGNHMKLKDGHWAMDEIEAAYKEGWLKIYTDGLATYEGDKFIPREEVAAVSNKAFKRILDKTYIRNNEKNLISYKDVKKDMWSYEDILCASNTFLYKKDLYRAHWIKEDNNQFNINTDGFEIVKAKFQRNPR